MMRIALSAMLLTLWLCSSCTTLHPSDSQGSQNTSPTKTTTFGNHVSSTLTEVMRDVIPVVRAMKEELSSELRTESTRVRKEWSAQMERPLPNRKKITHTTGETH